MPPVVLAPVREVDESDHSIVSLRVLPGDWAAMRTLALWLFHTPDGAVSDLPALRDEDWRFKAIRT